MKKITTLLALLLTSVLFAQAPEKMSYQAVIRNASNALVNNQSVGMRISILKTTATGTVSYQETQTTTTNANGLASIEIGAGTVVSGTFASIDWSADKYFVKTETDPAGGTSYSISGTSQLLSTPYALYAKKAGNGANLELLANQVSGIALTVPTSVTTTMPPTVIYNNVLNAPTMGSYNNTTGVYTVGAAGAGVYMIQARIHGGDAAPTNNTVSYCLNLVINNPTWGATTGDIIYGIYTPLNVYTPVNTKARGEIVTYTKLNANDTIKIVVHGTNSSVAPQNTIPDALSNIIIMKMN